MAIRGTFNWTRLQRFWIINQRWDPFTKGLVIHVLSFLIQVKVCAWKPIGLGNGCKMHIPIKKIADVFSCARVPNHHGLWISRVSDCRLVYAFQPHLPWCKWILLPMVIWYCGLFLQTSLCFRIITLLLFLFFKSNHTGKRLLWA